MKVSEKGIGVRYTKMFKNAKMGFQTDTLKSPCDWLAPSDSIFDWLKAAPG